MKEGISVADAHCGYLTPTMGADDAYLYGFLPELSFQSVLQPWSLTLMNYSLFDGNLAPVTYDAAGEGFLQMETWRHDDVSGQRLEMMKQERLNPKDFDFQLLKLNHGTTEEAGFTEPLINFFAASPPINPCFGFSDGSDFAGHFGHLPIQKSCEPLLRQPQTGYENEQLLFHFHPTDSSSLSYLKNQIDSSSTNVKRCAPYLERAKGTAKKRQRMSDKVRSLEKVLPWNRRMDTATMLEEAYKYVKFLQAQIRVLQAMPVHTTGSCNSINNIPAENPNVNEFGGGVLATLNRQQLLEVVMNSPGAHTVLYSRGTCVYSIEQLLLLKKIAEKAATEQILFPSSQY